MNTVFTGVLVILFIVINNSLPATKEGYFPESKEGYHPQTKEGYFPATKEGYFPATKEGYFPQTKEAYHNDYIGLRDEIESFREALVKLYTSDSSDSFDVLDEIMSFFDNDNQELCYLAVCVRKEAGVNNVRNKLKEYKGIYHDNVETILVFNEIIIKEYLGTYLVKLKYKLNLYDNNCSGYVNGEYYLFFDENELITKWLVTKYDDKNLSCSIKK